MENSYTTLWVIVALLVGAVLGSVLMPSKVETVASNCPAIPTLSCPAPIVNVEDTENGWKAEAVELATNEWSDKDFKAVFNELNNIDVKEDISSVVIKSSKVTESDSFSKDATVIQEIKVYYEDESGDDVKAYLSVETSISNGEVIDQVLNLD